MPLFKVMSTSGAFINDSLYREGEVVDLPEGENPNWGCLCDEEGEPLENYNEKVSNAAKLNEQLAQSIEGKSPSAKENAELAKENAALKKRIAALEATAPESDSPTPKEESAKKPEPTKESDGADNDTSGTQSAGGDSDGEGTTDQQIDNAVKMLEDDQDDQWTARGEPKLDLLQDIVGATLTRAQVDAVNNRRREKPTPPAE